MTVRFLSSLLLLSLLVPACADDQRASRESTLLRVFNAEGGGGEGFPRSLVEDRSILDVRFRIYQNGQERTDLERRFEFDDISGRLPRLDYGTGYQIIVEALGLNDAQDAVSKVLADGATPVFDFLEGEGPGQIHVFVSQRGGLEYASALYVQQNDVIAAPSEFEGSLIAGDFNYPNNAFGGQRAGHTVTELPDGRIIVIGGARMTDGGGIAGTPIAEFVGTIEIYEPFNGYWTTLRDSETAQLNDGSGRVEDAPMRLSVPRAFHTATLLDDHRILVVGGLFAEGSADNDDPDVWVTNSGSAVASSSAVDIIDVSARTIVTLESASELIIPRALHTAHRIGDVVVVIGGVGRQFDRPSFTNIIESYNLEGGFFEYATDSGGGDLSLHVGRGMHTGTTLSDGVIITGGRSEEGVENTAEFLILEGGALEHYFDAGALPTMANPRFGHAAVLMQRDYEANQVIRYLAVSGGYRTVHPDLDVANTLLAGSSPSDRVEFFDTWDLAFNDDIQVDMVTPRAHHQMVETSINGDLLIFGGINTSGSVIDSSERLNRNGNGGFPLIQGSLSDMNQPRAYARAIELETFSVMIIGGWDGGNSSAACGSASVTAGCTSELANPGELSNLGIPY
jgi:hypothetical protein